MKNIFKNPFGKNSLFNSAVQSMTGGTIDPARKRVNVPFTSAQMRTLAKGYANTYTGGAFDGKINTALDTKEAKIAGTVAGMLAAAATGAAATGAFTGSGGLDAAHAATDAVEVAGDASAFAPAAGSSAPGAAGAGASAAGTAATPGTTAAQAAAQGAGNAAQTASGAAAPLTGAQKLAIAAPVAGVAMQGASMLSKPTPPQIPPAPDVPKADIDAQQAAAEAKVNQNAASRSRTLLTSGQGVPNYGRNSFAPSLIGNNTYLKSVIG